MNSKLNVKTSIIVIIIAIAVISGTIYLATEPKHGGAPSGPDFSKGAGQPKAPPGATSKRDAKK